GKDEAAGGVLALSADGSTLLSANGPQIALWDLSTRTKQKTFRAPVPVNSLLFLPGERSFLVGTYGAKAVIYLFETDKPDRVRPFEGHGFGVTGLALLPDGRRLVSAGADGTVRVWTLADGKEAKLLRDPKR